MTVPAAVSDGVKAARLSARNGTHLTYTLDETPGAVRRVLNAAKAAARVARAVCRREPVLVSDEAYAERLAVCETNTCGKYRAADKVCTAKGCGCFLKTKARLATEDCPMDLWPKNIAVTGTGTQQAEVVVGFA